MNPAFVIEDRSSVFIFRLKEEVVKPYLASPKEFKKLLKIFGEITNVDLSDGFHKPLPIGDELAGRWVAGSPVGMEFSTPPVAWEFETRVQLALSKPNYPLAIFPYFDEEGDDLDEEVNDELANIATKAVVSMELNRLLPGMLDVVEEQKAAGLLDGWGDEDWTDGGTC